MKYNEQLNHKIIFWIFSKIFNPLSTFNFKPRFFVMKKLYKDLKNLLKYLKIFRKSKKIVKIDLNLKIKNIEITL